MLNPIEYHYIPLNPHGTPVSFICETQGFHRFPGDGNFHQGAGAGGKPSFGVVC